MTMAVPALFTEHLLCIRYSSLHLSLLEVSGGMAGGFREVQPVSGGPEDRVVQPIPIHDLSATHSSRREGMVPASLSRCLAAQ